MDKSTTIADIIAPYCAGSGRKVTEKRVIVATELARIEQYIDAVSLYIALRDKHAVSISCVYMSLNLLADMGLALVKLAPKGRKSCYKANFQLISNFTT